MNRRGFPESDWKVFRKVREAALERFCRRILEEIQEISAKSEMSWHERYLGVWKLLKRRDSRLGNAFNDPRRSVMMIQLSVIVSLGLLEPDEIAQFSEETRERVEQLASLADE